MNETHTEIKADAEFDRDAKPGERITFADVVDFGKALEAVVNFKSTAKNKEEES